MTTSNVTRNYTLFCTIGRHSSPSWGKALMIGGGGILTMLILVVVYLLALGSVAVLVAQNEPVEMVIEVGTGQGGWEIHAPDQAITIADRLYVSLDEPITLQVIAAEARPGDWSSKLRDKTELLPNQTNIIWLAADQCCAQQPPICLRAVQRPEFSSGLVLNC